jgi:hypothetical protein
MTHASNTDNPDFPLNEFDQDCMDMYGTTLKGKYKHYCIEFDFLPIDHTCFEFKFCLCYDSIPEVKQLQDLIEVPE